jgi:hypothetical protein
MYPKNAASPPKIFSTVVKAADGTAITSGVVAKYSTGGGSQAAGGGTCQHEGNGQWSYAPTQAETNVDGFGVQFYHADAVGTGPTVSVVTTASVVQTGDSYARLGAPAGASVSADIAAVKADTAAVLDDTGTSGVKLADDAITSAKFDESSAFPLKSADTGATAVARTGADSDTLETLSDQIDTIDASGTAAAVWSYTSRTLTALPAATTDGTTAGSITRKRGDSWSISLTVGAITGYTSLWLTVKSDTGDADASSLLMVKKNASLTGDGLLYVNGATAGDATKGSITVSNATTGAITIAVDESVTDDMAPGSYSYDVQTLVSGAVTTVDSGTFAITPDVTRAIA